MLLKPPDQQKRRRYRFDIKRMNADCEANYARLCRLLPALNGTQGSAYQAGDCREFTIDSAGVQASLQVTIQALCRYTTMLNLNLKFDALATLDAFNGHAMHMQVRLYHDVRLAEVITMSGQRSALASYEYPNQAMFAPDEKAQQNAFLAEWLCRCLRFGHASNSVGNAPLALDVGGS
ncbi:MAG: DUF1249 domain-containing protein [Pseudomonadales bacterium]|nr:DUF1249 domain-containing protein [Pseudomonadales bacterium]